MNCEKPYCTFALTVLAAAWVLVALFIGETELLRFLPTAVIPVTLWSLVGLLLAAYWKSTAIRAFVDQLDARVLISLHLTRFVGFYFLYLSARGELPETFAKTAGWGDIAVASGAVFLLFRPMPWVMLFWNGAGLLDILYVVVNAAAHLFRDRSTMAPFAMLPLSFLPTLVVPLIISSHFILFRRLLKRQTPSRRGSVLAEPKAVEIS